MYKTVLFGLLATLSFSGNAFAHAFEQCSTGNPNTIEYTYKLYGKDVGQSSKEFFQPTTLIKVCATTEDHKVGLNVWDTKGNLINDGFLKLYGPKANDVFSKSCWMGPATRIEFQSLEFDRSQVVCVKGFISPQENGKKPETKN